MPNPDEFASKVREMRDAAARTDHDEHCNVTYAMRFPLRHGSSLCNCRISEAIQWLYKHERDIADAFLRQYEELIDSRSRQKRYFEERNNFRDSYHDAMAQLAAKDEECRRLEARVKELEAATRGLVYWIGAFTAIDPDTKLNYCELSPTKNEEAYKRCMKLNDAVRFAKDVLESAPNEGGG